METIRSHEALEGIHGRMQRLETRGLVLYNRNFREDDKLVKIFTEGAGKRMFLVKHASRSKLTAGIQALTLADYSVKLNEEGLGYIDDVHQDSDLKEIQGDIFRLAYATYVVSLADACMQDGVADADFAFVEKTLELMEAGLDAS